MGAAVREVVHRRQAQRLLQLPRPARRRGQGRSRRLLLRRRARGRPRRDHLRRAARRGGAVRERLEGGRREEGDAGGDLHGHGPAPARGDARVRAAGRATHGRLRRVLGRIAVGPPQRHGVRRADHPGRGLAPRTVCVAEGERRRGARVSTRRVATSSESPRRTTTSSTSSGPRTSTGAPPTSAGSPATATSSTGR